MLAVVATYVSAEPQFPFGLTPGFPLPLIYNSPPVYYHKVEGDQEKGLEKTPDFYHKIEGEELKGRSLEKKGCRNNEGSLVPCAHAAVEPSHEVGVTPRPLLPYLAVDWTGIRPNPTVSWHMILFLYFLFLFVCFLFEACLVAATMRPHADIATAQTNTGATETVIGNTTNARTKVRNF